MTTPGRQLWDNAKYRRMKQFNPDFAPYVLPCVSEKVNAYSDNVPMPNTKVPSVITNGLGHGFRGWTTHQTSDADLKTWAIDRRLGWGVHCRHIRAIDVDIDTEASDHFQTWLNITTGLRFVTRRRVPTAQARRMGLPASRRVVLLYRSPWPLPDDYAQPKVVVYTAVGNIEFLGDGNYVALEGHHYDKAGNNDSDYILPYDLAYDQLPVIMPEQYEWLIHAVQDTFGTKDSSVSATGKVDLTGMTLTPMGEQQAAWVRTHCEVLSENSDGKQYLTCPWSEEHTNSNKPLDTMFIGENDRTGGAFFKCLHAHCQSRRADAFLEQIGFRYFDPAPAPAPVSTSISVLDATLQLPKPPSPDMPAIPVGIHPDDVWPPVDEVAECKWWETQQLPLLRNRNGDFANTLHNITLFLSIPALCGYAFIYDTFRDTLMQRRFVPGTRWSPMTDNINAELLTLLSYNRMEVSAGRLRDAIQNVMNKHQYHSAERWIRSLTWDGRSRMNDLAYQAMGLGKPGATENQVLYERAVVSYILSAMAARIVSPGCQVDMVPVLIGKQGIGKSRFVQALSPFPEWFASPDLASSDDDIARLLRGKVMVELPELRGLKSRDIEHVKAWVTTTTDNWVPKYREHAVAYRRSWIAIGTANDPYLYSDPTGGRRWLPLEATSMLDVAWVMDNRLQLWAEGLHLYETAGIAWQDVEQHMQAVQRRHRVIDPWEPLIAIELRNDEVLPGVVETAVRALHILPSAVTPQTSQRIRNILMFLAHSTNRDLDLSRPFGNTQDVLPDGRINESLTQVKALH